MSGRLPVAMAVLLVLLGVAVIVRTVAAGVGGGLGLLLGGLLILGGCLRLWMAGAWRG